MMNFVVLYFALFQFTFSEQWRRSVCQISVPVDCDETCYIGHSATSYLQYLGHLLNLCQVCVCLWNGLKIEGCTLGLWCYSQLKFPFASKQLLLFCYKSLPLEVSGVCILCALNCALCVCLCALSAQALQDPGVYGVIQSGDHKGRTCVVKWIKLNSTSDDVEVSQEKQDNSVCALKTVKRERGKRKNRLYYRGRSGALMQVGEAVCSNHSRSRVVIPGCCMWLFTFLAEIKWAWRSSLH